MHNKERWKRCPSMPHLQSQTSLSMHSINFFISIFLTSHHRVLGWQLQQLFTVAGISAKHFPGTPTRAKPVFYRHLQSKHFRPIARFGFEILKLLSPGIPWHSGLDFYLLFHIVRVTPVPFCIRGHQVPNPDPIEKCNHSFELFS